MKIVIQDGSNINRENIGSFLKSAKRSWLQGIESINVNVSVKEPFHISFHSKEKVLGIHISNEYKGSLSDVLESIAVATQAINEIGHLPSRLSKSHETEYKQRWLDLGI